MFIQILQLFRVKLYKAGLKVKKELNIIIKLKTNQN